MSAASPFSNLPGKLAESGCTAHVEIDQNYFGSYSESKVVVIN